MSYLQPYPNGMYPIQTGSKSAKAAESSGGTKGGIKVLSEWPYPISFERVLKNVVQDMLVKSIKSVVLSKEV